MIIHVITIASFIQGSSTTMRKYWAYYAGMIQPYSLQQIDEDASAGDEVRIRPATQDEFDTIVRDYTTKN